MEGLKWGDLKTQPRIDWVGISIAGYILTYSRSDSTIVSYSINGRVLAMKSVDETLHAFCLSEDGQVLMTGGTDRRVHMRWCHSLRTADDGPREGLTFISRNDGSCDVSPFIPPRSTPLSR